MITLKFRFIFILIFTGYLSLTATYAATPYEWRVILHLSGKQRMLTQKMSKEIFLIAKGIHIEENRRHLYKTAILFDWTLKGLLNGEKRLRLVKTKNLIIIQQLKKVTQHWKKFHQNVDAVLMGETSTPLLEQVAVQNLFLLNEMDKVVKMYEKESGSRLTPMQARTLNLAGKQRMLTQKITKELLLVANAINPIENRVNLKNTMSLFERTLKGLLYGDATLGLSSTHNSAIRTQLRKVDQIWKKYKSILKKSDFSQEDLVKAAQLNIPLLREMDNAVKMYVIFLK